MPFSDFNAVRNAHILVVNDAPDQLGWMSALFSNAGYVVHNAEDADAAFQLAKRARPILVISDVAMPGKSGIELCRMIRADRELMDASILLFSTLRKDSKSVVEGLRAGANDYIEAPCDSSLLLTKTEQLIKYKLAEAALRESEERYRDLVENRAELICAHDLEGRIISINAWGVKALGVESATLLKSNIKDLLAADAKSRFDVFIENLLKEGSAQGIAPVQTASGERRLWSFRCTLRKDGVKPPVVRLLAHDVTELKQAEERLRKSDELFKLVARATNDAIWDWNLLTNEVWRNENFQVMSKCEAHEIGNDLASWTSRIHPDDLTRVVDGIHRLIKSGGAIWTDEYRFRRGDGTYAVISDRGYVVHDGRGKPVRMVGSMIDITERKQAEEALQRSEEYFRSLIDNSTDVVSIISEEGVRHYISPSAKRVLGYSPEELIGGSLFDLLHPDDIPHLQEIFSERLKEPGTTVSAEFRCKHKNGAWRVLEVIASNLLSNPAVGGVVINSRDITERKCAEEALLESERDYRELFNRAHDAILILAPENETVLDVNQRACEVYGFSREEFIGLSLENLSVNVNDGRERLRQVLNQGNCLNFESVQRRKDGSEMTVEINASLINYKGRRAVLSITRDVTDRKQLEEQLRQSQKMEAIGRLAGGVAHDFNNLLTAINGYSELALRRLNDPARLREQLTEIKKAGERAASLTRQLLAFSRKQILQPKTLNLNDIVMDMSKMLRRLIGEDIELVLELSSSLGQVKADPSQIEQVILNLAINARDAMPQGGRLIIETSNVVISDRAARRYGSIQAGHHVCISIADTGCGIDPAMQQRIFEPFFTTKEIGKGTGLGLSTVYGIVKQSGGYIFVHSEAGRGATFKIYLPRVDEAIEPSDARESEASSGSETVLLVEDDELIRKLTSSILEEHGYKVIEAEGAHKALEILERSHEEIRLMVTDVIMPAMSGKRLADKAKLLRPGMRVLFISGYTDEAIVHHGVLNEGIPFLQKPFTPDALAKKVREILDKP